MLNLTVVQPGPSQPGSSAGGAVHVLDSGSMLDSESVLGVRRAGMFGVSGGSVNAVIAATMED